MDTRLDLERGLVAAENDLHDALHDVERVTEERDALLQLVADVRERTGQSKMLRVVLCRCPLQAFVRPGERLPDRVTLSDRRSDPDWHDEACVWRRLMQTGADR